MDPQKLSQLDPKLREAYQRVMGTTIPTPPAAPIQTQAPPPSIPSDPTQIPQPQPIINPQSQAVPMPESVPTQPATNFVQMNSEVPAPAQNFTTPPPMPLAQTMAVKKKSGIIMPILFGFAALVFIAIYTLFWTKIFNFNLPFKLPFLP
ncbi:MAG: hypothetical protein A3B47_03315 [Candidatus Levybacteria bacterium RIFCSPLOWO2_01_FULL_39_24]|nr:MAG: hypothetical protein A2800_02605 [Candidatus Levybacteria bacterium RIFCSPHIGHO2_01_FULL_40_16]OGH28214.1 MAG: hypothetical protein A3E12_00575 [Candidatus Levybacteria bacterium RIFCSPHIGHO2_12_FULL_39_9]OGH46649.1 MAG: hypothetical protein A3B47_03315 [Candidatus Levybacteria bacterium RIFCSPLOWO2_01_FULL_39_24]